MKLLNLNEFLNEDEFNRGELGYQEFGSIDEASLSRLLNRTQDRSWAILTAFRDSVSYKQNVKNNQKIIRKLNSLKLGPYLLQGHWQEAPDDMDYETAVERGETTDVVEDSILVVNDENSGLSEEEFFDLVSQLGFDEKWKQDAIIIGTEEGSIYLLFSDGNTEKIGSRITVDKISQAYSNMKDKQQDIPFVFEGALSPDSNSSRRVLNKLGINWVKGKM